MCARRLDIFFKGIYFLRVILVEQIPHSTHLNSSTIFNDRTIIETLDDLVCAAFDRAREMR